MPSNPSTQTRGPENGADARPAESRPPECVIQKSDKKLRAKRLREMNPAPLLEEEEERGESWVAPYRSHLYYSHHH